MYHLLRRRQGSEPEPTPEQVGEWVREHLKRGLKCSQCGNLTGEDDAYCGQCGHYLNAVIDEGVASAVEDARNSQEKRKRR